VPPCPFPSLCIIARIQTSAILLLACLPCRTRPSSSSSSSCQQHHLQPASVSLPASPSSLDVLHPSCYHLGAREREFRVLCDDVEIAFRCPPLCCGRNSVSIAVSTRLVAPLHLPGSSTSAKPSFSSSSPLCQLAWPASRLLLVATPSSRARTRRRTLAIPLLLATFCC
jgi:hypothetical protein